MSPPPFSSAFLCCVRGYFVYSPGWILSRRGYALVQNACKTRRKQEDTRDREKRKKKKLQKGKETNARMHDIGVSDRAKRADLDPVVARQHQRRTEKLCVYTAYGKGRGGLTAERIVKNEEEDPWRRRDDRGLPIAVSLGAVVAGSVARSVAGTGTGTVAVARARAVTGAITGTAAGARAAAAEATL